MKRIVVTGGSGKAGRAILRELAEHGYETLNVDVVPPTDAPLASYVVADLADYAERIEDLHGVNRRMGRA